MIRGNNIDKYEITGKILEYCELKADDRLHYLQKRILTQQVSNQSQQFRTKALLLDKNIFCGNSTNYILIKENKLKYNLKILLGLINSTTFNYFFNYFSSTNHITCNELNQIPIPEIPESAQQPFITLVNQILAGKKAGQDTSHLEHQIDVMVYHLYGLNYAEACVIDKELKEEDYRTSSFQLEA